MKRRRLVAVLVIGLAGAMFVAPIQASAGPGTRSAEMPAVGQPRQHGAPPVALSAVENISRSSLGSDGRLHDSQEQNRLYRDSRGRTRHESGSVVTINDPVAGTTVRMDTRAGTYTTTSAPAKPSKLPATTGAVRTKRQQLSSEPRSLGTAWFGDVKAEGRSYTVTTPRDNAAPDVREVTTWLAPDIQLAVQIQVTEASGARYTRTYTDVRTKTAPPAELFTVPSGYRQIDQTAAAVAQAPECPLTIAPDPLILTSFTGYIDGNYHIGYTDFPNTGCVIAQAAAALNPFDVLGVAQATPILQPAFAWFWYDNGGPVPFLPYVVFGESAFLAANVEHTTVGYSAVILTVFG
ncbi:LolA family protein [Actinophytocola sp.]|uniref:LolA family protein n=1 Tax=Actinophytocola sp. TaxID=1872138 RepID=UPI003899A3CE